MTVEELNERLYEKMYAEHKAFVKELQNSTTFLVIEQAYELVIREDMLIYLEENGLPANECKALLKEKKPMEKLFEAWQNQESGHMDEIRDCIEHFASVLVSREKERKQSECR